MAKDPYDYNKLKLPESSAESADQESAEFNMEVCAALLLDIFKTVTRMEARLASGNSAKQANPAIHSNQLESSLDSSISQPLDLGSY